MLKIKLLIENANIKYANLVAEFQSQGITTMTVDECKNFMRKTVNNETLHKIFNILVMRGYIRIMSGKIFPTNWNFVNRGTKLDANDENFAIQVLNKYGTYDAI